MSANPAAENALGTIGTICWTIQLIPQIWKSWRAKSTEGLSEWLVLLWGVASAPMGVYNIVQDLNIPLIVQPQLFGFLCFTSWIQCQYYGHQRSLTICTVLYITYLVTAAGFQVGMVYAVRPSYERGNDRGTDFFGILSSVLIALALLPQYYEIYRRREVVGISIPFMTIDMLGGVFSVLSLAFKSPFNVIGAVTYSVAAVMDSLVILLALILNPLASRRRKRAALATVSEDAARAADQEPGVELVVEASKRSAPMPAETLEDHDRKERNRTLTNEIIQVERT